MMKPELEASPSQALWCEGWYRYASVLKSPNFGSRPVGGCVDLIVVHSISLPPGQFGNHNVQRFFTNELDCEAHPYFSNLRDLQVSSHVLVHCGNLLAATTVRGTLGNQAILAVRTATTIRSASNLKAWKVIGLKCRNTRP